MEKITDIFLECALTMYELNNLKSDDIEYEKVYGRFAELFSKLNDNEKAFLREEYNFIDKLLDNELQDKEKEINKKINEEKRNYTHR